MTVGFRWMTSWRQAVSDLSFDERRSAKARRDSYKAKSEKARSERQAMRRVMRFARDFARKNDIELADRSLRVVAYRGKRDRISCQHADEQLRRLIRDCAVVANATEQIKSGVLRSFGIKRDICPAFTEAKTIDVAGFSKKPANPLSKNLKIKREVFRCSVRVGRSQDVASPQGCCLKNEKPSSQRIGSVESKSDLPSPKMSGAHVDGPCARFAPNKKDDENSVLKALQRVQQAPVSVDAFMRGDDPEKVTDISFEQGVDALWQGIEMLENSVKYWQTACEKAEFALYRAEERRRHAETAVLYVKCGSEATNADMDGVKLARLLVNPGEKLTISEALMTAEMLLADRLVVLPSAYEAAEQIDGVSKRGSRFLSLVLKLGTEYFDTLVQKGDAEARKVFTPAEFAACESESVKYGRMGRMRDFIYKEETVRMNQHLKLGTASDKSVTLRCYFAWIAKERRIVIGYCGEHLPVATHTSAPSKKHLATALQGKLLTRHSSLPNEAFCDS